MALAYELDRARRSDGRFVIAFVDVDRLKAVNDREGHTAGDRVLQIVVHDIRSRLPSSTPSSAMVATSSSGETADELMERADAAMLAVKARHHEML